MFLNLNNYYFGPQIHRVKRIRERLTGDVRHSVPLLTSALESELDTQMFILRNVAKQINREGGFLQRLIPALRRDSEVYAMRCAHSKERGKQGGRDGQTNTTLLSFSLPSSLGLELEWLSFRLQMALGEVKYLQMVLFSDYFNGSVTGYP